MSKTQEKKAGKYTIRTLYQLAKLYRDQAESCDYLARLCELQAKKLKAKEA